MKTNLADTLLYAYPISMGICRTHGTMASNLRSSKRIARRYVVEQIPDADSVVCKESSGFTWRRERKFDLESLSLGWNTNPPNRETLSALINSKRPRGTDYWQALDAMSEERVVVNSNNSFQVLEMHLERNVPGLNVISAGSNRLSFTVDRCMCRCQWR